MSLLLVVVLFEPAVHCPGHCRESVDLDTCISTGHACHHDQYCKVTKDGHNGDLHGRCEPTHDMQHCQTEMQDGHCDPHHYHCTVGCCQDDQCVSTHFDGKPFPCLTATVGCCQDDQCVSTHFDDSLATTQGAPGAGETTGAAAGGGGDGSGSNTLTCGDLADLDCSVLAALCPKVDCPSVCDPCMTPAGTDAPVNQGTQAAPASTVAPTAGPSAPASATDPDMAVPPDNTMAPPAGSDSPDCVDTIENMSCSDVTDVCSSPLLISFCQKHCGMCCEAL